MGAVTLALVGFFAFVILRVSRPEMGVLYSDLSVQDAGAVVRDLETRGIRYETKGDTGQTVLAPRDDLARLRMDLAARACRAPAASATRSSTRATPSRRRASSRTSITCGRWRASSPARSGRSAGCRRRASTSSCREAAVLPRPRGAERRDRRAARRRPRSGPGPGGAPPRRLGGRGPEARAHLDRRRARRLLADGARGAEDQAGIGLEERQTGMERRLRNQVEEIVAGIVGQGRAGSR